jgi:type I restriction enzyme, S subunit
VMELGELPDSWAIAELAEICLVNPTIDKSSITDELEVSFVPMPAVEAETGAIDVSATRKFGAVKKGYTPFREGDVLFAKITPCMENGKMAVVPALKNGIGFGSTEFHVLRAHEGICPEFVYYFVSSKPFRRVAEHNMSGAVGQRRATTPYLSACKIPAPPTAEQHRIVAKIEELFSELDQGVASLKTAREQLKVYRQSLLKTAFEGKLTAAVAWREKPLGQLLGFLTSGSRGWAAYYASSGDLFVRAQNIKHDCLELDDVAFVSLPDKAEGLRTRIQQGDLLITITGANVTKAALVKDELGTAFVSQHVALCRPTTEILPDYLYWFIVAEAAGRKQLTEMAYGAGKPGLNLENIRSVQVPLPSLSEQQEIVELIQSKLSEADQLDQTLATALQQAEALRQSILKKAFCGQLVNQDKNDEPATALLDRIRAEKPDGMKVPGKRGKSR